MRLYFDGKEKNIPVKTMITRRLLSQLEDPLRALRESGSNTALEEAIKKQPKVIAFLSGDWTEAKRASYKEAYPNADDKEVDAMVQKALAAALFEEFPEVLASMSNPATDIKWDNDASVQACFEVAKVIVETKGLTTEEMESMGTTDFWDDQDVKEVAEAVATFRDRVQQRV